MKWYLGALRRTAQPEECELVVYERARRRRAHLFCVPLLPEDPFAPHDLRHLVIGRAVQVNGKRARRTSSPLALMCRMMAAGVESRVAGVAFSTSRDVAHPVHVADVPLLKV